MNIAETWSTDPENKITLTRKFLSRLSVKVREKQFEIFWEHLKPKPNTKILDVGVTPDEILPDSNFFEKRYPFKDQLVAVSVEDCQEHFQKDYPKIKFIKISPGKPLPFGKDDFDIVVSWATLEHVGNRKKQKIFLEELFRVGKRFFFTTPDKNCFYEPHSGLFFAHWLPYKYFSLICRIFGKKFWAKKRNLNPLTKSDIYRILPKKRNVKILNYKMFRFIPSHLIIVKS